MAGSTFVAALTSFGIFGMPLPVVEQPRSQTKPSRTAGRSPDVAVFQIFTSSYGRRSDEWNHAPRLLHGMPDIAGFERI